MDLIRSFALAVFLALPAEAGEPWFVDATAQLGVDFLHQDARFGEKFYVETAASGGGFLDADGDGDLDLFLVQGAPTPGSSLRGPLSDRLYENRGGRFVDVTERAGVGDSAYGMGLCAGDVDADGRLDFLVTNYGPDRLYRNLGNGQFEEIGAEAGVDDPRWSASCAFGDLDGDGDLDLYVTHYVDFHFDRNPFCGDRARGLRAYCRPEAFAGVTDSLYVNQGVGADGRPRFRDEAVARGIAAGATEKGFGVVMSDLDGDGDLDVYVSNDGTANRLYVNDGRGRFRDEALLAGVAFGETGHAQSGMGVDVADADADGRFDVLVTNYSMEPNVLYRNLGDLLFEDVTRDAGLAEPSYRQVGWGTRFFDADNDGDLDLAVANGHAIDNIEIFEAALQYRQLKQLYVNDGRGRFREAGAEAGPAFAVARVSRGLAVGDVDGDGRLDLLVTNTNDPPEVLLNRRVTGHHWLGLKLAGAPANPFAIGARVRLTAGNRTQVAEVRSGGSFLSQSDLRLHFGLGTWTGPVDVDVRWPDGRVQRERIAELDGYRTVRYSRR